MKRKLFCLAAAACLSAAAVAVLAKVDASQPGDLFGVSAARVNTDFSTKEITRRIWFINNDNYWESKWTQSNMQEVYVHAWQASENTHKATSAAATLAVSSYGANGLYYADVTFVGAGDEIGVVVMTNADWSGYQTIDISLPSLADGVGDVIYLNAGETDNKRNASIGTAGMSSSQMAEVLEAYKTCSDSYAYGYNAYPQFAKNFYEVSTVDDGTAVNDYSYADYVAAGNTYTNSMERADNYTTIGDKVAAMEALYNESGWSASTYSLTINLGIGTNNQVNWVGFEYLIKRKSAEENWVDQCEAGTEKAMAVSANSSTVTISNIIGWKTVYFTFKTYDSGVDGNVKIAADSSWHAFKYIPGADESAVTITISATEYDASKVKNGMVPGSATKTAGNGSIGAATAA